jgi:hypothetical protein
MATENPERSDIQARARAEIEDAEGGDDKVRLATLEGLSEWLETELEQATPPGR